MDDSCSQFVTVQFTEIVSEQNDLALKTVIVDCNGKKLKNSVHGDYHSKSLGIDSEL